MEAFGVDDDLSYSVTMNTWGEQLMEEVTGNTSRLRGGRRLVGERVQRRWLSCGLTQRLQSGLFDL